MSRWIVSLAALFVVSSVFAQGSIFDKGHQDGSHDSNGNSYCDTTPTKCDPKPPTDCNPKPPTNCVPEPGSVAVMAIGGAFFLKRKKKSA